MAGDTTARPAPYITHARTTTDLLVGTFPNVLVYPGSGLTGFGARVRMRGQASLALGNRPLVYVDGVRVEGMPQDHTILARGPALFDDVNPEDVDSVVVVRGPAAGGLHGPEAANGVIQVYTARGRAGRPRWHVYAEAGRLSDGTEWPANYGGVDADNADSVYRNGGCSLQAQAAGRCVQDFVRSFAPLVARSQFRSSPRRRAGAGVAGGMGPVRYAAGVDIEREAGIYELSDAEAERLVAAGDDVREQVREPSRLRRNGGRASVDVRVSPAIDVGAWVSAVSRDLRLGDDLNLLYSGLDGYSDSTRNDGWIDRPGGLFQIEQSQEVDRRRGGIRLSGRVHGFLTVDGLAGWDAYRADERFLVRNGEGPDTSVLGQRGFVTDADVEITHRTLSLLAAAHYRLGARLAARTALGVRETKRALDAFARSASPLPPGSTMPDSTANSSTVAERLGERLLAVYAEQRLTSGDRLVVTAGVRADAGDVPEVNLFGVPTGEHHDLVLHPSIRLEWLAARPAGGVLERLDLHAAYGTADQRVAGSDFLTPERTAEAELGIRAELWDGRAAVDLVGYGRRLSDGIAPTSVVTYGNAARVHNTGIELALAAGLVRSGGVAWDVRLAAWGNRNRFADTFPPLIAPAGPFQEHHIGYPLGGYWGRSFTFADANGNRVIEPSEVTPGSTFVFLGTPIPSHGGSLWSSLVLGGSVRVTGLLEYRAGHHLFNATARSRCLQRVCPELYDRRTSLERQAAAVAARTYFTLDGFVEDADFVKLRELAVSLDLPAALVSRVGARTVSVTLSGRNLLTWTNYSGGDPEVNAAVLPEEPDYFATGIQPSPGFATLDSFVQPPPRVWTLRLDVGF